MIHVTDEMKTYMEKLKFTQIELYPDVFSS